MKSVLPIKPFGIFLVVSVLIILLDFGGFVNPVKSLAQIVILPAQSVAHSVSIGLSDTFSFLTFWRSGEARIKYLEQRNLELLTEANKAITLEKENIVLRSQLGVKSTVGKILLPAAVLGKNRYLSLAVGSSQSVEINMPVIYLDNYIGRVVKVSPLNSFVELPNDASSKISAKVGVNGTVRGLISGQYNSSIILDHVSQDEEIRVGDQVLTEDNLLIGFIQSINSKDTDLFKQASVKPVVDPSNLVTVFIIVK